MKKLVLLFVVMSLAIASTSFAQPARFQQMVQIQVAPVHQPAFENYVMKVKEAADKTESSLNWTTLYVPVGKPEATYRIGLSFDTWAERDQWGTVSAMLTEAFGEDEAAQILRAGRVGIVSQMSRIWERLPDGSSNPRTGGQPANFYQVAIRHVDREMVPEFRSLQRKWKASYEAASNGPSVGRSILRVGPGSGATFRRAEAFDTWAERDAWSGRNPALMTEHLGEAEQQLMGATQRRVLEDVETFVSAYRPDLSRLASSPTSD